MELTYRPLTHLASKHSVTVPRLTWWCRTGRLPARRFRHGWFVSEEALVDYLRDHPVLTAGERRLLLPAVAASLCLLVVLLAGNLAGALRSEAVYRQTARPPVGVAVFSSSDGTNLNKQLALTADDLFAGLRGKLDFWLLFWRRSVAAANQVLTDKIIWLRDYGSYLGQKTVTNWRAFILGAAPADNPAVADLLRLDNYLAAREELKREIVEELRQEIAAEATPLPAATPPTGIVPSRPSRGLIVVPSGEPSDDAGRIRQLQAVFSDEVRVQFDQSGAAGVITPVFRGTNERGDYLFVLTPIKY